MYLFFENNKWRVGWTDKRKTRIRIESKEGRGFATAYLAGRTFDYGNMDMFQRAPRIEYINGGIVPSYIRAKITSAFSMGQRWR
jgi:hypothetical protein